MKFSHILAAGSAIVALSAGSSALADSISPETFEGTTTVGGTLTLKKTVTVSAGRPTSVKADVFFVTDTTGSMGSTINTVKSNFNSIATSLAGSGDFAFGAAEFKDFGDGLPLNSGAFKINQDVTTSLASVQTGINSWVASGGGDLPEQGLLAINNVSDSASWRAGAERIIVVAGDATAKTPPTTATVGANLAADGVTVHTIDVGNMNGAGQFNGGSSIYANGAAGTYRTSFGGSLVADILAAIGSSFDDYSSVSLQVVGAAPGVGVSFTPLSHLGDWDRSVERTFGFDLTFTGLTVGVHEFTINALVDGGIVATEFDKITVTGGGAIPEPATWAMMIAGFAGVGAMVRTNRRRALLAA